MAQHHPGQLPWQKPTYVYILDGVYKIYLASRLLKGISLEYNSDISIMANRMLMPIQAYILLLSFKDG